MKTIRRLFLAGLLPIFCVGFAPPALRPVESKPVNLGGLEFSVVTEADWNPDFPRGMDVPLVLQLRIRNTTAAAMLFPTFDSFSPVLTDSTGKELRIGGGRDKTTITPNVLIPAGKDFCLQINARIRIEQTNTGDRLKIGIKDGTGTIYDGSVDAGVCRIGFNLRPTHFDFAKEGKLEAKLWGAEGKTEFAEITIHPARRN